MQNGLVVNLQTRSLNGTNKETKKITYGFTKSYIKKTKEKKESEEIMPRHYGGGMKPKKKKKKKNNKKKK